MTTRPASMATRVAAFLKENRRKKFRCLEIGEALGISTQHAATECGRLYRKGLAIREHVEVPGRAQPITYYRHGRVGPSQ